MRRQILTLACALAAGAAYAGAPGKSAPERAVQMFNIFCMSQLPGLEGISQAAGFGEFAQITGDELKDFAPAVPVEELRAWRFHEQGEAYVLTAATLKPDATVAKEHPAFARSTGHECSLRIPSTGQKDLVLNSLSALLGRKPDRAHDEDHLRLHAWSGKKDKLLILVRYAAPASGVGSATLTATAFVRD
jgi:hypothetical protein